MHENKKTHSIARPIKTSLSLSLPLLHARRLFLGFAARVGARAMRDTRFLLAATVSGSRAAEWTPSAIAR